MEEDNDGLTVFGLALRTQAGVFGPPSTIKGALYHALGLRCP